MPLAMARGHRADFGMKGGDRATRARAHPVEALTIQGSIGERGRKAGA